MGGAGVGVALWVAWACMMQVEGLNTVLTLVGGGPAAAATRGAGLVCVCVRTDDGVVVVRWMFVEWVGVMMHGGTGTHAQRSAARVSNPCNPHTRSPRPWKCTHSKAQRAGSPFLPPAGPSLRRRWSTPSPSLPSTWTSRPTSTPSCSSLASSSTGGASGLPGEARGLGVAGCVPVAGSAGLLGRRGQAELCCALQPDCARRMASSLHWG